MVSAVTLTGFLEGAVAAVFAVAVVGIVVALLSDDRDPTTVIAWLLVVILVPFVGVILYFFIGRNYRRETPLRRRVLGEIEAEAAHVLTPIYAAYGGFTAAAKASLAGTSARKLAAMSERAGGTPILPATSVDVFTTGEEKFASLLAELRGARHHIHLMYLIWERDELTAQVTEILLEKLAQGVEVRILYDFVTCLLVQEGRTQASGCLRCPREAVLQAPRGDQLPQSHEDRAHRRRGRLHRRHEHGPGVHRWRPPLRALA